MHINQDMEHELNWLWFANDGGPLLVLPREAASYWEGGDVPSGGRVVEADFRWDTDVATDYDRACDVEELAGLIDIGPSWGLVLDDDIPSAAWVKVPDSETFFIVRVYYANDGNNDAILKANQSLSEADWKRVGSHLSVEHGELVLLHAAGRLDEYITEKQSDDSGLAVIGDAIVYKAKPGKYSVDICEFELEDEAHFTFFRFTQN